MPDNNKKFPILNLPPVSLKTDSGGKIFDPLRHKWIVLTPEEWVRQHFVAWLINGLHYPPSLIANEIGITLNDTSKRCDTVVFLPNGNPLIIVEYKAPDVHITQKTFDQIVRYNMVLNAKYLIISNGINHYCCVIDYKKHSYSFIPRIPDYNDIRNSFSDN